MISSVVADHFDRSPAVRINDGIADKSDPSVLYKYIRLLPYIFYLFPEQLKKNHLSYSQTLVLL